ncbi:MAG TPA: hypothetical protein VGD10_00300 [Allosphingosinicella sp.]|uniref:hypothetical protein n=1 Tax=Allosphingosinicella sp. TaxID=2823234 RepID=UPI002EDB2315
MLARPERRAEAGLRRTTIRAAIAAIALAAAAKILTLNLADHAVRTRNPMLLQALAPVSPHSAALAAEAMLTAGDTPSAERLARAALQETPYSAAALRTFGLSLEAQGRPETATAAMAHAGGLGWRDTPTQLWLMDAFVRQGDYEAALERADALARRRQHLPEMRAVLLGAALDPAARPALIARLQQQPNWRGLFFDSVQQLPPERYGAFTQFLADFAAKGGRPAPWEMTPLTNVMFKQGRYAEAKALWRSYAAGRAVERGNLLLDGGFTVAALEVAGQGRPFEWTFPQPSGSETALEGEDRTLRIASNGNIRLEMARQTAVLAPGRYTLSYDVAAGPGTRIEGYSWQLTCVPSYAAIYPDPPITRQLNGATRVSQSFTVPAAGCGAQQLQLLLRSGAGRAVDLRFDNVALRAGAAA